ncbi:hypothetical protein [Streptomyces sp. NPDC006193]|uniref:DUF6973 domain-containing protein n=1 Tax=Streptomyces sp. NPDC006193 TaxID=3155717 RepID=UPI0033A22D8B
MSGSSVRAVIVKDPRPGDWTMRMNVPKGAQFHCECNTVPNADVFDTMVGTWQELSRWKGLETRDTSGAQIAAFLGLAVVVLLAPLSAQVVVTAMLVAATGAALAWSASDTAAELSRNVAEVSGIVTKIMKDVQKEGFAALGKYKDLIGKNISDEEYEVIRARPWALFQWIGIHRRVYEVVEHMTDAEEQNAVRHVYWQCLLKKRLGEEFAVAMGDAHERGRPGSDADNRADEINNGIGLRLADEVASEEECLKRAREMWKAGELATRRDLESDPT